jgi:uncharacterized 2Fe-2S/4Fe-4S cluster protein (DUF4445 family)
VADRLWVDGGDLSDILFEKGVEFPCGGMASCGACRIRVLSGEVPPTAAMREVLSAAELSAGWRLACQARANGPVLLAVEQWEMPVLSDDASIEFEAVHGLGIAVDVGTTTLVAQLLDLSTGQVIDVRSSLNPQCRHGADIMTRVEFELRQPGVLTSLIRSELGRMTGELAAKRPVREVLLCGNTVMHHLFCEARVEPLSHAPFETPDNGSREFEATELGWPLPGARVTFLPCLGGFVGSDILAGILAAGLHRRTEPAALVDLGTNGEIVVGGRDGLLCASTAAGPAFEAGRIRMGMRAAPGAIDRVSDRGEVHVLGGTAPRGLCGSGLVDAVAAGLDTGRIKPGGRFSDGGAEWTIAAPVVLCQRDIRELQLAKGAVAAGIATLAGHRRALSRVWLAGAFGNYVRIPSARRIGLLPQWVGEVEAAGNTALRGVKMLLLAGQRRATLTEEIRACTTHVRLACDPRFQDYYPDSMTFPDRE